ncbi:glycosyl transferase family protein (plasmid) [Agrobacterium tumefaciens]|uniref:Glycosyl transferase family protein n=3 Tax=Agrobacterium tumefaciens TaxID=358 RepID=A0AAP9J9X3_AGRTU|nr:glycosyl transferase family protein [Agrobacterium tumefaciens]QDY97804.1 glycosyl transferase family protein [Agrobacterium tumefaciens]UXS12934.1 glycosyl transferase family protein [Agrobacterium tumefaciens]UXS20297.1 glycosyl transferase family protein [Agrobacterium tumefaciens]UXS27943.1 glycosyl transferase family protein [Agrobacterium tumefaciens]
MGDMKAVKRPHGGLIHLNRVKLLFILDTLLREGSVGAAAKSMGVQISAMSRMLSELREHYGDAIFDRTGRGMRPTEFAESLRLRVRGLAEEAEDLLLRRISQEEAVSATKQAGREWLQQAVISAPPLAVTHGERLEATPSPRGTARRLATIGHNAEPHRRLAKYIATTAPGPGRSRPLGIKEAEDALGIILRGEADPIQIGALLMTMQYRGLTASELAGFVRAIRHQIVIRVPGRLQPHLDWPAYLSPKWREPLWFMHSVRLVAMAGYRVVIHGNFGSGSEGGKLEAAARDAGISVCLTSKDAVEAFTEGNLAYVPLGALAYQVQAQLALYPLLEMRTPLHSAVHLMNPLNAKTTLVGAADNASRDLYRQVAHLLDMERVSVIGSTRDFAQVPPGRATQIFRLVHGRDVDVRIEARRTTRSGSAKLLTQREYWAAVWSGGARDQEAEDCILHTAAVALMSLSDDPHSSFIDALEQARSLWVRRTG